MSDAHKDNGGSAFPNLVETLQTGDIIRFQSGMTLRDWFAGQAMSGMLANGIGNAEPDKLAWAAYHAADAMLEARE